MSVLWPCAALTTRSSTFSGLQPARSRASFTSARPCWACGTSAGGGVVVGSGGGSGVVVVVVGAVVVVVVGSAVVVEVVVAGGGGAWVVGRTSGSRVGAGRPTPPAPMLSA